MHREVDVAIIGAGSAGLYALSRVRKAGKRFVLINGGEVGTTCARVGCMPSKVAIQVAEDFHRRHILERYGVTGTDALKLDVAEAMEHVRDLRDTFVDRVTGNSTDDMGEEFVQGYAEFLEPGLLRVGEDTIRAGRVVIATGSRPFVPAEWEPYRDRILTTDNLFEQEELPDSVAVLGLGVIGIEIGQSLARLGVNVTGIDRLEHVAGLQDPEVNRVAVESLGREFPLWLGQAAQVSEQDGRFLVSAGERNVLVDRLFLSLGRIPNLDGLGLERLGVERDARGVPRFDPHTMQLPGLPVFIAGDVTGDKAILHEAGDEGRIAGYNAAREEPVAFRRKTPLAITFCDPNIASVGLGWTELQGRDLAVGEVRFGPVGRALIMGKNRGLLRVYADKADGRLLGAAMMAPKGENLAHLLAWAIQQGNTVFDLLKLPFYHPVIEEALQAALYDLAGKLEAPASAGDLLELDRLTPA